MCGAEFAWRYKSDGKQWFFGSKPNNDFAFKNQIAVALIAAGALIIALPIFVLGLIRVGWGVAVPWAARRQPQVKQAEKNQQSAIRQGRATRTVDIVLTGTEPSLADAFVKGTFGDEDISLTQLSQFVAPRFDILSRWGASIAAEKAMAPH